MDSFEFTQILLEFFGFFWSILNSFLESFGFFCLCRLSLHVVSAGCLCRLSLQAFCAVESFEPFGILQSSSLVGLGFQLPRVTQQFFGYLGRLGSREYLEPCFTIISIEICRPLATKQRDLKMFKMASQVVFMPKNVPRFIFGHLVAQSQKTRGGHNGPPPR